MDRVVAFTESQLGDFRIKNFLGEIPEVHEGTYHCFYGPRKGS